MLTFNPQLSKALTVAECDMATFVLLFSVNIEHVIRSDALHTLFCRRLTISNGILVYVILGTSDTAFAEPNTVTEDFWDMNDYTNTRGIHDGFGERKFEKIFSLKNACVK